MIPVVIITWYRAQSSALSLHHWYLLNVFTNTYIILLVTSLKQNDGVRASHTTSSLKFDPWWRHITPAAFLWSLTWWVTHLKNRCYTWWWYARLISGWLARICMGTAKIHKIRFSVEWPLRAWDDCCSEIPTLPANIVESWNLRPPGLGQRTELLTNPPLSKRSANRPRGRYSSELVWYWMGTGTEVWSSTTSVLWWLRTAVITIMGCVFWNLPVAMMAREDREERKVWVIRYGLWVWLTSSTTNATRSRDAGRAWEAREEYPMLRECMLVLIVVQC